MDEKVSLGVVESQLTWVLKFAEFTVYISVFLNYGAC
jgi:hypothetical protein